MTSNQNKKTLQKKRKKPSKFNLFGETNKKLLLIIGCSVLSVALLSAVVIVAYQAATADVPYNINFKKYIEMPEYIGLKIKNEDIKEDCERQKRNLLLTYAEYEEMRSGIVEEGYRVTIDATGYLLKSDGTREETAMESGSLTDYVITDIGNHYTDAGTAFSSEIQEAVIGKDIKNAGTFVATIKYPDNYNAEALKGKTAEFDITIKKAEKTTLPEYNDTFVLAKTGFKNIEDYEKALEEEVRYNLVWNTVVGKVTVKKFPMDKVDEYRLEFSEPYNDLMEENKMTFAQLLKELDITEQTYFDQQDSYAYGLVREEMILYCIARTENIKVSESDYQTIGLELAKESGYSSFDEFEEVMTKEALTRSVLWQKVKVFLVENTVFE